MHVVKLIFPYYIYVLLKKQGLTYDGYYYSSGLFYLLTMERII